MANTFSYTTQGGPLPTNNAAGNGGDAPVECTGGVGADEVRAIVSQALSALIGSVELRSRASCTADDDPSQQQPPLPLPLLDGGAVISANEIRDEVVCDYNNKNSVNNFYPKQKGKSKKMIPIGPLKLLHTDAEKHSFCMKWRNCTTTNEQDALSERCKKDAETKKKAAKAAKERDARMKRKREEEAKQEKKRKKEEASKAKARERQIRQNESRKRKRVDANAEKENTEPITGLLSTASERGKAGDNTMSSKVVKSSKRRTTNETPTQLHQLNDATTRRIEQTTYDKIMNFKSATTFADEDKKKTAPLVMQVAITATSIATPTKSGGKRKAKNLVRDMTKLTLVSSSSESGLDPKLQKELYNSGTLNAVVSYMKQRAERGEDPFDVLTNIPNTPPHVTKINSKEQLDAHREKTRKARARASTGKSMEEILDDLGDDVISWKM